MAVQPRTDDPPLIRTVRRPEDPGFARAFDVYASGYYERAVVEFEGLLELYPRNPTALFNLGQALFELGAYREAAERFELSLKGVDRSTPGYARGLFKFGVSCLYCGRYGEALPAVREACDLEPWQTEYQHALAQTLATMGYFEASLPHFHASRVFMEAWAAPRVNEAYALLHLGRWSDAWPLFEARRMCGVTPSLAGATAHIQGENGDITAWLAPMWLGQDLRGKRLLVRREQGLGDCMMFVRYVPLLLERGAAVVLDDEKGLERLWRWIAGVGVVPKDAAVEGVDYQTSLMSLPLVFGTVPETVPPPMMFAADCEDVLFWERTLGGVRIGLCYEAGIRPDMPQHFAIGRHKSISMGQAMRITDSCDEVIWSLQKSDIDEALGRPADMADTAALVSCLDLVISVDTSVAHLAASMGKEVWLLNPFDSCWRWRGDGTEWYPTVRKFQQAVIGEWDEVVDRVVASLKGWINPEVTA